MRAALPGQISAGVNAADNMIEHMNSRGRAPMAYNGFIKKKLKLLDWAAFAHELCLRISQRRSAAHSIEYRTKF